MKNVKSSVLVGTSGFSQGLITSETCDGYSMTLMAKGAELLPNAPVRVFVQRTPACGMTGEDSAHAIDHSAREAGDPIANQLEADKEPEHGQDHGAVLGHPVLQAVEQ